MSTVAQNHTLPASSGWFARAEAWLDDKGKGAWIAAMVLGFVFVWPVGLALLIYMIWSNRMFSKGCGHRHYRHHTDRHAAMAARMGRRHGFRTSGNSAFDAYKADTLHRLMDEQEQFEAFLDRLRSAKDKSEFDQFMEERAEAAQEARGQTSEAAEAGEPGDEAPKPA